MGEEELRSVQKQGIRMTLSLIFGWLGSILNAGLVRVKWMMNGMKRMDF